MKKYIFKYVFPVAVILVVVLFSSSVRAQIDPTPITTGLGERLSRDAIYVRAIPNPNFWTVFRWFREQGFTGSAQSQNMVIDGYDAIRMGRTTYVAAANVSKYCRGIDWETSCTPYDPSSGAIHIDTCDATSDPQEQCVAVKVGSFMSSPTCTIPCATDSDCGDGNICTQHELYSNIYLLSHTQDPDPETEDIVGALLSKWRFNTNLDDLSDMGKCDVSSLICASNEDCKDGMICYKDFVKPQLTNRCILPADDSYNCLLDAECPDGLFCSSVKARIIRDMRRLTSVRELSELIEAYKTDMDIGLYPMTEEFIDANGTKSVRWSAGSYLPGKSTSLWDSWGDELGPAIGLVKTDMPLDPINRFGDCPGYAPDTCWNENDERFAGTEIWYGKFGPPYHSHAYTYSVTQDGLKYSLCAQMESSFSVFKTEMEKGECPLSSIDLGATSENQAPYFLNWNLAGESGKSFKGYIRAADVDGDSIKWKNFDVRVGKNDSEIGVDCFGDEEWAEAPQLKVSATDPRVLEVTASRAGRANDNIGGSCGIKVTISDGTNEVWQRFDTIISNKAPVIEVSDITVNANKKNTINISPVISDNTALKSIYLWELGGPGMGTAQSHQMLEVNFPDTIRNLNQDLFYNNLKAKIVDVPVGNYAVTIDGKLDPASGYFKKNETLVYKIVATDEYDQRNEASFKINVVNTPPTFTELCGPKTVNVGHHMPSCLMRYEDKEKNDVSLTLSYKKDGVDITVTEFMNFGLNASFMDKYGKFGTEQVVGVWGTPQDYDSIGRYEVGATLTDDYGAVSDVGVYNFEVQSWCGDKQKQSPNTQGTKGPLGNGYEDCDTDDGLATCNVMRCDSNPKKQYGCSDDCVYEDGWCDDGSCQSQYGETAQNCPADCP